MALYANTGSSVNTMNPIKCGQILCKKMNENREKRVCSLSSLVSLYYRFMKCLLLTLKNFNNSKNTASRAHEFGCLDVLPCLKNELSQLNTSISLSLKLSLASNLICASFLFLILPKEKSSLSWPPVIMHVTSHSEITIEQGWTDSSQLKRRLSVRDPLFNVNHFVGLSNTKQKIEYKKYHLRISSKEI
jgi:hypothetical protein